MAFSLAGKVAELNLAQYDSELLRLAVRQAVNPAEAASHLREIQVGAEHSCTIRREHFLGTEYTALYSVIWSENIRNLVKNDLFWPKTPNIRPNIHRMPNGRIRMVQVWCRSSMMLACQGHRHHRRLHDCQSITPVQWSRRCNVWYPGHESILKLSIEH